MEDDHELPGQAAELRRLGDALKGAEAALAARAAEAELILASVADGVVVYDRDGRIVRSNEAADVLLGYAPREREVPLAERAALAHSTWLAEDGRPLAPEDSPALRAARAGETTRGAVLRRRSALGERWLTVSAAPLVVRGERVGAVASFSDVTEQKRAEEAKARLAAIVASTDAAIVSKDRHGTILTWNAAAERLLGWSAEEVVGRPIDVIVPPDLRDEERAILGRVNAGEVVPQLETRRVRKDGTALEVSVTVSPIRDRDGAITGVSKILRDITGQKATEAALRDANERLREADRRKDEFLGMLSHELRNPLAPIRNALFILERAAPGSDQARRAREVAARQVAHITRLVDDLLDVTRIARGKIELRRAELDLAALARRSAEDHRAVLQARGLKLGVEVPPGPVTVHGDETRLAQVLGNLLHNASKFTPAGGGVTVALETGGGRATVHVRDTGAGIAPEAARTIFEPFTQAAQTLARAEGGLGLGLALVKGLVALHGGEVGVESAGPGRGSDFSVTLPLADAAAATPGAGAATAPAALAARRRVLVVDDNRDAAETLAELVELLGHEVEVAYDGPSAVGLAEAHRPDLVLCDLGLPGMDGYEVARRLRAGAGAGVRLVALSGYAQPEDVARALEAGFDGHVAKPPDPARLERLLR